MSLLGLYEDDSEEDEEANYTQWMGDPITVVHKDIRCVVCEKVINNKAKQFYVASQWAYFCRKHYQHYMRP
jgi:hypothetical protein